jgi:hypothetical protein
MYYISFAGVEDKIKFLRQEYSCFAEIDLIMSPADSRKTSTACQQEIIK